METLLHITRQDVGLNKLIERRFNVHVDIDNLFPDDLEFVHADKSYPSDVVTATYGLVNH